jgi:hypothetical protein
MAAEPSPDPGRAEILREDLGNSLQRRLFEEVLDASVFCQQCLNFLSQGVIAGTGSLQKGCPLIRIALSGSVIQLFNLLRAFCRRTYLLSSIHGPTRISQIANRA